MIYRKKLIEVALPLPEINDASAYDKMPGIGPHPKGIHHWWARLPLPTARAVLFASVVDDPSAHPEKWPTEEEQTVERERIFAIIRRMMGKKLHDHPEIYAEARAEMLKHTDGELPIVFDPFAGGGSIPLEAIRLGFEAQSGDLNPVAVLLNKCNLEIAPRWAGRAPVNPDVRKRIGGKGSWPGTLGLAADVRFYGRIIRDQVREKIGHLYPKARLTKEYGGGEATVIAWIWARTVSSPDPAVRGVHVPLMSTSWLSSKKGREVWLEPVVDRMKGSWHFQVRTGAPIDRMVIKAGTKTGRAQFRCLLTGAAIPDDHIKAEGVAGRLGSSLLAIVAAGKRRRVYLDATQEHEAIASKATPSWKPDFTIHGTSQYLGVKPYGMGQFSRLFTQRQLNALVILSDLVKLISVDVVRDGRAAGYAQVEAEEYACAVKTFLALAVDRCADYNNALCGWSPSNQKVMHLFGLQAIPMIWDFSEANILADSVGGWSTCSEYVADCIEVLAVEGRMVGVARQIDAAKDGDGLESILVSTDPPYYANIPYSNIADFFYVWLRRTIRDNYPDLFGTVLLPKTPELVAAPERFDGDKKKAREHFESGFREAFTTLGERMDPRFPLTVYYALKQTDVKSRGSTEDPDDAPDEEIITGWDAFLEALVMSGFQITATWPVRASQAWRRRAMGSNALASYIILACRLRPAGAPQADRRSFVAELKRELPVALRHLQQGNIAPVDFAQAAIGPGMAIYSRFSRILEASGRSMTVRTALSLINQTLSGVLSEQDDEFDPDTRWAISWFEQHGFEGGEFGVAETLSKAKNTSVSGMIEAGILTSKAGKVRLLRPDELPKDWDPTTDKRLTVWEAVHHLIRVLGTDGEPGASDLIAKLGSWGEVARDLAYRLFSICERKKRAPEALAYNGLVQSWPEVMRLAREAGSQEQQATMFEDV